MRRARSLVLLLASLAGVFLLRPLPVFADTVLAISPITWNVVGLDSNNVMVGPNNFPVGARVCNSGSDPATGVTFSLVWDSTDSYINLRPGSYGTPGNPYPSTSLAASSCTDVYFEIEITRDAAAYDHVARYHIVADSNETLPVSTPTPREIYVEHLISQSRNATTDVRLNGVSVAAGGTMSLMVGNTYDIELVGSTATNGYEQIETFINFPNTIFRINAVNTTYTAPPSTTSDLLYGDGCTWENDPNSLNYRSCLDVGKYGGSITVTYNVTIIGGGGTTQTLNSLIYDFSGSSYHYNSDFGFGARYASIVNATIIKAFSPKSINPGGTSTLTFTINNPGPATLAGVNFADPLPSGLTISSSTVTYSGCGISPSPSSLTVGATFIAFSNIAVGGLSTCTVSVSVTASTDATYANASDHLFVNTTFDTGSFASDSLVVSSKPPPPTSCTSPATMATWSLENYTASTSTNNGPFNAFSQAPDVLTAIGTYGASSGSSSGIANTTTFPTGWNGPSTTGNLGNSWGVRGDWLDANPVDPTTATTPFFQFHVDASQYGGIGIVASYNLQGNWSNSGNWYVLTSADGINWSAGSNAVWDKANAWQIAAITTSTATTGNTDFYFRVFAAGAQYSGNPPATTGTMYLDSIQVTGCPRPNVPTLSKGFAPATIPQGSASTLTFTFANPNTSSLTGVGFSDTLPSGLVIDTPSGLTAPACTPGSISGQTITANAGTSLVSMSGATLTANASCSFSVSVKGNTPGQHQNISGSITAAETGPNTSPSGYGTASLAVVAPPVIAKSFTANPIFTGNTTNLVFSINNPNPSTALTGVAFTDTLPAGLSVADSSATACGGGTLTTTAATRVIALSGGSLPANTGCTFSVPVTGTAPSAPGVWTNSVTVSSTNGGTGNTAVANVLVKDPAPAINLLKQVGPTAGGPWTSFLEVTLPASVYYRFAVENVGDVALSSVNVTDPSLTSPSPADCSWFDGDGTPLTAPFGLPVADSSDGQLATCVLGPFTAEAGTHTNTATADSAETGPDTDDATYFGKTPALNLTKTESSSGPYAVGSTITYSLVVANTGNVTLTDVTVSDPQVTVGGCAPAQPASLAPLASMTCPATYVVTQADMDAGSFTNTATADSAETPPDTDSKTVTFTQTPALTIDKSITAGSPYDSVGDLISYSYLVTNSGNVTLSGPFVVFDDHAADESCPATATLAPGVSIPCTSSYTVTQAELDAGSVTNAAYATGSFGVVTVTSNTDTETAVAIQIPGLTINKVIASGSPYDSVGDVITYSYLLTNTGTVTLDGPFSVFDDHAADESCPVTATLTPGASLGCSASYTVTQSDLDAGAVTNAAYATGNFGGGTITSNTDTETASATQTPGLTMVKSITGGSPYDSAGDVITYSYLLTNTGNVTLDGPFTVFDDHAIDEACPAAATLAPGASITCSASYTTTPADLIAGSVTNAAYATGSFGGGTVTSNTDTQTAFATQVAGLTLDKSISGGDPFDSVGDVVNYSFLVTNTGNVTLDGPFTVFDDHATDEACPPTATLAPGASITCSASYTIIQTDLDTGTVTNAAYATGSYLGGTITSNTDTATAGATQSPQLTIAKAIASGSPYDGVGDVISYSFLVTNTGNVTLDGPFTVVDDHATDESCPATATLAPGASLGCTASFAVTQADLDSGTVTNAAYATGSFDGGTVTSNTDTETATATQSPGLTLVKSITGGSSYDSVGDLVSYSYLVTNSGNVTLDGPFTVFDDHATDETCPATATLAPGASVTCAASYTITQADIDFGSVTNAAYATGLFESGTVTSNTDTETATATQSPGLTVVKSITSGDPFDSVGDIINYSFLVTNSGNVTLDGPFTAFDDHATDEACPATATLAPGANIICTASYTVTQADLDAGAVTNAVFATGSFEGGTVTSNTDDETATATLAPELTLVKSITGGDPYDSVGDVISYSFVLTNSGNVTLDGPFTLFDDQATDETCPVTATLAPSAFITCTATYTITQADLDAGSVTNAAYATGFFEGGVVTSNTDTEIATGTQSPALTLAKSITGGDPYDSLGDVISYAFLLTNTGNVTLDGPFTVFDDHAIDEACPPTVTLAPGAGMTCTASYMVTQSDLDSGSVTNSAYATGSFEGGTVTSNTDSEIATAMQMPGLSLLKSITAGSPYDSVGDVISYSYLVTNTGNVTLDGPFTIFDDHAADEACPATATLAAGASITCTATYTIIQGDLDAGFVTNAAYATGSFNGEIITSNTDTETAIVTAAPALTIVKSITSGDPYDSVGDVINYSFVLTNSGNVTLDGPFTVFDDHAADEACPATATLAPGASITCTASYAVAQADLDAGSVTNAAYATGSYGTSTVTSNTDTETATATQSPGLTLIKSITGGDPYDTVGDVISYSFLLTNSGNVTLDGPFTVFDDHSADESCPPTATLAPLASVTCSATYTITPADILAGSVTNAAYGTGQFEGGTVTSNTDTETAYILLADLTISKSDSPDPVYTNGTLTYTLQVANLGPSAAANISVVDTLPPGVVYVSASGTGWACGESAGVITCTRAALIVGSAPDITVVVTAPANPATITNTVSGTTTTTESDSNNNNDTEDTQVVFPPGLVEAFSKDLVLTNQVFTLPPQVAIGEILTYEIALQIANGTLPGAAISDVLARGLAFVNCASIAAPAQVTASAGSMAQVCANAAVSEVPPGSVDPQDQGREVRFDFGTLTNTGLSSASVTIRYRAVVLDSASNTAGLSLSNLATWEGPGSPISDAAPSVMIVEPLLEIDKSVSPTVAAPGTEVTFDLVVSAAPGATLEAFDLVVRDALPAGLTFHPGTLDCTLGPQAPSTCLYNGGTNEIIATWDSASGFQPSLGNGIVRFGATIGAVPPGTVISNEALLSWTSLPGDVSAPQSPHNVLSTERSYDPPSTVDVYGDRDTADITVPGLPQTGFAPGRPTDLGRAPAEQPFANLGGLRLVIPSIDVATSIVGVPLGAQGWDLTWLSDQVGYLEGTAYPTWDGNTGLTAHVYLPDGEPGPFLRLSELRWGDRVVIEAFGQRYIYEVRESKLVKPDDARTLRHEERPWLTLITCQGYDEERDAYRWRRVVRAVLVEVEADER